MFLLSRDGRVALAAANEPGEGEPGRFPAGVMAQYFETLSKQSTYTLVIEKDGRIVAAGGMAYQKGRTSSQLSFGLVHPEFQGQGIGTALLYARLALLPGKMIHYVVICALKDSIGFYTRFGFGSAGKWKDAFGGKHPLGLLTISGRQIRRIRHLLLKHGIEVPLEDQSLIPETEEGGFTFV